MRMRVFAAAALLGGLIAIPVMQAEAAQVPAGLKTTAGMTTDLQLVGGGGGHGGGGGGGGHMGSFAGRARQRAAAWPAEDIPVVAAYGRRKGLWRRFDGRRQVRWPELKPRLRL